MLIDQQNSDIFKEKKCGKVLILPKKTMSERLELSNREGPEGNEKAKTRYFSSFALAHGAEMKILRKGGILGKGNADWRNISEHCLAEAVGADILAEHLGADRNKVVQAALLHDWYKRREIETMRRLGDVAGHEYALTEDSRLLTEYGVPQDIVRLTHSNIPESTDSVALAARSPEEKIIHYADMMTLGSDFVDITSRLDDARKKPEVVAFTDSYREQYGGKSLLDVQEFTTKHEEGEFEKLLGLEPGTLLAFIKEKLAERIRNE